VWKIRAFAGRAQDTEVHLYTVILFRYKTPGSIETNVSKLSRMFFFSSDLCCTFRGAGGDDTSVVPEIRTCISVLRLIKTSARPSCLTCYTRTCSSVSGMRFILLVVQPASSTQISTFIADAWVLEQYSLGECRRMAVDITFEAS